MTLLFQYHMLHNILLKMWMLEYLVLHLCYKEQEQECHIYVVLLHKSYTLHQNDIELHRLFCLVLLFGRGVTVVVHYLGAVFGVYVVWVSVTVDVHG